MEKRLTKLFSECRWNTFKNISADSFRLWRAKQTGKSGTTLNQYLDSASGFLNWLVSSERILKNPLKNPLKNVEHVDVNGKYARKRRAFSDDALGRLLAISGERRLAYLTAVHTGLRRGELKVLEWRDIVFDGAPTVSLDATRTKNKKDAKIPLHPDLLQELQRLKPRDAAPNDLVFRDRLLPSIYRFKKDLEAAGIVYKDAQGRQADFHSLRACEKSVFCSGTPQDVVV